MEPKVHQRRRRTALPTALQLSVSINLVLVVSLLFLFLVSEECTVRNSSSTSPQHLTETKTVWYGGHPLDEQYGSCWCGDDNYCMCTPSLAIDLIITTAERDFIWLVRRKDTNQLAVMGGFVEVNESAEEAIRRELLEEMSFTMAETPTLVGMYSDPRRDNRRHTASVVYAVRLTNDAQPRAGDDAKEVLQIPIDDLEKYTYFADHGTILLDYRAALRGEPFEQYRMEEEFVGGVVRSTCGMWNNNNKKPV